ncbi:hypothetical protein DSO57_1016466 [Entomophthora muscae]|uniref:Uncharacterized protein n=1 Tax=Entomophthora muscae TaxID=34485 RepID=A0ACC2U2P7_9FUNG|nr:hypothetical protein DSO57_1016466 [Entomophthora muscae]
MSFECQQIKVETPSQGTKRIFGKKKEAAAKQPWKQQVLKFGVTSQTKHSPPIKRSAPESFFTFSSKPTPNKTPPTTTPPVTIAQAEASSGDIKMRGLAATSILERKADLTASESEQIVLVVMNSTEYDTLLEQMPELTKQLDSAGFRFLINTLFALHLFNAALNSVKCATFFGLSPEPIRYYSEAVDYLLLLDPTNMLLHPILGLLDLVMAKAKMFL